MSGHITTLFIAALLAITIAIISLRRSTIVGMRPFAWLMISVAIWSAGYALEILTPNLEGKVFWARIQYLGIVAIPILWLIFAMQYTGNSHWQIKVSPPWFAVEPAAVLILLWSGDYQHLIWNQIEVDASGQIPMAIFGYGAGFWVHTLYSYVLLLTGTILVLLTLLRSKNLFRKQSIALLVGVLAPWLGNALYLSGLNPFRPMDITPFAFTVSGIAIAWGLLRYRFMQVSPVAHSAIVTGLQEGVFVLDCRHFIVELNLAAEKMLNQSSRQLIGKNFADVIDQNNDLHAVLDVGFQDPSRVALGDRIYDLQKTTLNDDTERVTGFIVVLRDVTDQVRTSEALKRREMILEAVSFSATGFLLAQSWEETIQEVLERLGRAVRVSRVNLFQNQSHPDSSLTLVQQYGWAVPGISSLVSLAGLQTTPDFGADLLPLKDMFGGEQGLYGSTEIFPDAIQEVLLEQGIQSLAVFPIYAGAEWWGFITFEDCTSPRRWPKAEIDALAAAAGMLSTSIQRKQLDEEAQLRARRLTLLNEITRDALGIPDQSEMLTHLARHVAELVGADGCYLTLWDDHQQRAIPAAAFGPLQESFSQMAVLPGEVTMTEKVMSSGRTLVVEDTFTSSDLPQSLAAMFPRSSILALPLIAGDSKLGAALITHNRLHRFTQEEIELSEQAAAQIALAVAKSQLLEMERRRANELDALRATAAEISMELDLSTLLGTILKRAVSLLNATGGDLGLYNADKEEIEIVVSHKMGTDYSGTRMAVGEGAMGRAVETNQPVVVSDYRCWVGRSPQYANGPWHAVLAVPLHVQGRIVGALGIVDDDLRRNFTPEEERLLELFAQQATIVIENAHHYAAEKQHAADLAVLYESSTATTRSLDLSDVCNTAAEQLTRLVHATSVNLLSLDRQSGVATLMAEYFSPQANDRESVSNLGDQYDLNKFPDTLALLRAGKWQTLYISDPNLHPSDLEEMTAFGVKSSMNLPMIVSDHVIGYAEIWDTREERIWTESEIKLCQTLANQAAIAIENARLYDEMRLLAITDVLTGVYNRRGLFEHGVREISRALRYSRPLAAIMLDIDHFKQVNDIYSHAIGDQVLQALAEVCATNLREMDILGRYGGEEFAILLPETDELAAYQVAQRLRGCVADTPIPTSSGPLSITISIGVACTRGQITDLAVLLDRADSAMYAAKNAGRNLVCVAGDS